ncbi:MAG: excinuclease ABC subunit UvrC [Candidatus Aminicenantes bacterium]|nr:excinuclease ABC subunit UvrC [Candidatus Aminicenantes bacterium]
MPVDKNRKLLNLVKRLPEKPGIYFFKNTEGNTIYIGKASSLAHRVRSYFLATKDQKIINMISETEDIDFIITGSEREASFLENNFVRDIQPKFNVRLKDDKSFPYLKLTVQDKYPGIYLTRRVENDGSRYFGPFSPAYQARKTIELLARYFGLRTCKEKIPGRRKRPCLEYDLKLCSAPCVGLIGEKEYQERVENARMFLEGKVSELKKILTDKMKKAAEDQEYERAALWRDFILTIDQIKERPQLISVKPENQDIFGFSQKNSRIYFYVFIRRAGKVIGSETWDTDLPAGRPVEDIFREQLLLFYKGSREIPDSILLPLKLDRLEEIKSSLSNQKKSNVKVNVPLRGENRGLIDLAGRNASLASEKISELDSTLQKIQEIFLLPDLPLIIEGFDISNTGGDQSVGSMVVFKDGIPHKQKYRRFNIRTVQGPNDVSSLEEVIKRRYRRVLKEKLPLPDLILIDGGKGQLHAALKALKELGLEKQPVLSLAKKEEILFSPVHKNGVALDRTSSALKLFQHIRDEAHRFAVSGHRRRREKKSFSSVLDDVPGIGKIKKARLLEKFQGIEAIHQESLEEIAKITGKKTARQLKQHFSGS